MNTIDETGTVRVMVAELKDQVRMLGSISAKANAARRSTADRPAQTLTPRVLARPIAQG